MIEDFKLQIQAAVRARFGKLSSRGGKSVKARVGVPTGAATTSRNRCSREAAQE